MNNVKKPFSCNRRDFLATGLALGALSGVAPAPNPAMAEDARDPLPTDQRDKAKLRISSQLLGWIPGNNPAEKMKRMKDWGMEAVEVGGHVGQNHDLAKEYKTMADDAGLEVSVICGGVPGGELCSGNAEEARLGFDKLKKSLEGAAILECNGLIFVPSFNGEQERIQRTHQEIRKALIDLDPNTKEIRGGFLKEAGDFAASLKTNLILEPLNRKEAWFLRQVADGAAICRDAQSEGVKTMGDFYHMFYEEVCDMGAFLSGGTYVKHVHLGSGNQRIMPGQDPAQSFVSGFRGLKFIGYRDFLSFECGCLGGDDKGAVEVPQVLDFIRKSWEEA